MTGIFINYRQNHYPGTVPVRRAHALLVEAIAARLAHHFGPDQVFLDVELRLAIRYPDALRDRLAGSDLVIAVIHENWLDDLTDRRARPGQTDWVHHELATALAAGTPVLPLLIDSARLPGVDELPPDIAELGRCQAHRIQFGHWRRDLERLIVAAEHHVSTEPAPQPEPEVDARSRSWSWFWLAIAALLGLAAPYGGVRYFLPRPQDQLIWLGALALVGLFVLFVLAGTAGLPYVARKWLDTLDYRVVTTRDQRTNAIIGLTIFGLAVIFMNTSKFFTPNLEIFILACVVLLLITAGAQWLRQRRSAEIWPPPKLDADPASIRGAISRVDEHLTGSAPLMTRRQRDHARFALDQIGRELDQLRADCQTARIRWLRAVSPWLTAVPVCLLGATAGASIGALALYWTDGGRSWQAPLLAAASLLLAAFLSVVTFEFSYRLRRWRRQVVLDTAPPVLAELERRFAEMSIAPRAESVLP